jgi:hypothetical protein
MAGGDGAGGGGAGVGAGAGGAGAGGGGAATGLPARLDMGALPPPHAASVAAKATASLRIARSFIDTSCNRPERPQFLCQTPWPRYNVQTGTRTRSYYPFQGHGERRNASLASNCIGPWPGDTRGTPQEETMATPTEHRANIITQDLARAEELTRRQYQTATEIAAAAGAAEPSVVTGVLAALALNFATLHTRRD